MGALTTGVVLAILLIAALWIFQRRLIYFPFGEVPEPSRVGLAAAEPVVFPTTDGLRLHGWLVPPLEPRAGATVLVFNGNAGHRGFRSTLAATLRERGYGVLLFDYRGYGGNPGTPTEDGLAVDARAARSFVLARPEAAGTRLRVLRGVARQRRRHAARRGAPAGGAGAALAVHLDGGRRRLPLSAAARALAAERSLRHGESHHRPRLSRPGGRRRPGHRRPLCAEPAGLRRGGRAERIRHGRRRGPQRPGAG